MKFDGELYDLGRPLPGSGHIEVVTDTSDEGRSVMRHSAAHVLAQAVLSLYDGATFAIGPPIDRRLLLRLRQRSSRSRPRTSRRSRRRWTEIIAEDQPFVREEMGVADAGLEVFARPPVQVRDHRVRRPLGGGRAATSSRVPIATPRPSPTSAVGPHVPSTGTPARRCKLLRTAGAYWRGDENQSAAAAHLRHRLGVEGGPRGDYLHQAGGGRRSATTVGSARSSISVQLPPVSSGQRARRLAPEGRAWSASSSRTTAAGPPRATTGSSFVYSAHTSPRRTSGRPPATSTSTPRPHVPGHAPRRRRRSTGSSR